MYNTHSQHGAPTVLQSVYRSAQPMLQDRLGIYMNSRLVFAFQSICFGGGTMAAWSQPKCCAGGDPALNLSMVLYGHCELVSYSTTAVCVWIEACAVTCMNVVLYSMFIFTFLVERWRRDTIPNAPPRTRWGSAKITATTTTTLLQQQQPQQQ